MIAGANIASLGSILATRSAYLGGLRQRMSTEASDELARQQLRSERQAEMAQLERRLAHLESFRPLPLVRSAHRLDRERSKMEGRIQRLAHELSILES